LGASIGFVQRQIGTVTYRDYAGYGQGTYAIFDKLKFTAGIRYTDDRTTGEVTRELWTFPLPNQPLHACLAGVQDPTTCHTSLETSSSSPTWLLDLEYTPVQDLLTYVKYTRGYRTGGIIIAAPPGYLTFQPEHIDDYELGEKYTFNGPVPGYIDIDAFYNRLTNQQVPIGFIAPPGTQGAPSGSIGNLGKSRVYGFELESAFRLYEGLTWNLSYTYLNTRIQEVTQPTTVAGSPFTPTNNQVAGAPFNGVPNHKLSTTASYRLPFGKSIGNLSVATTYSLQGRSNTGLAGSFSQAPSISLLNLNVNWESVAGSPIDAEFFVTNLTDHYYALATSDFSTSLGFLTRVLGEPRMFGARLRYHFGK
jgi:iron complex outermembrane receptor protein